jgi:hypothetical protein
MIVLDMAHMDAEEAASEAASQVASAAATPTAAAAAALGLEAAEAGAGLAFAAPLTAGSSRAGDRSGRFGDRSGRGSDRSGRFGGSDRSGRFGGDRSVRAGGEGGADTDGSVRALSIMRHPTGLVVAGYAQGPSVHGGSAHDAAGGGGGGSLYAPQSGPYATQSGPYSGGSAHGGTEFFKGAVELSAAAAAAGQDRSWHGGVLNGDRSVGRTTAAAGAAQPALTPLAEDSSASQLPVLP